MTSLVSEFIINPVLAQARRFSLRATETGAPISNITSSSPITDNSRQHDTTETHITEKEEDEMADEEPDRIARLMRDASLGDEARVPDQSMSGQGGDTAMQNAGITNRPMVASPAPLPDPEDAISTSNNNGGEPHPMRRGTGAHQPRGSGSTSGHAGPSRLLTNRSLNTNNDVDMSSNQASPFPTSESPAPMSPVETRSDTPQTTNALPEFDANHELRRRILEIHNSNLSPEDKAMRAQELLAPGWSQSQNREQVQPKPSNIVSHDGEMETEHNKGPEAARPGTPPNNNSILGGLGSSFSLGGIWGALQSPSRDNRETPRFQLTAEDLAPTYVPPPDQDQEDVLMDIGFEHQDLGCQHYKRNVKLQCNECKKWYTCRLCHDAAEPTHNLPRKETKYMLCMLCGLAQTAADTCKGCNVMAANYYCDVCKLWEGDVAKPIYHCNDCGICRKGMGLGKDFVHCKVIKYTQKRIGFWAGCQPLYGCDTDSTQQCGICMTINMHGTHRHIERSAESKCPICIEVLFDSAEAVIFMRCGHSIHRQCYRQHMQTSYKCPICQKSVVNMETQFRSLDRMILNQPMPEDWRGMRAVVSCNDCTARSISPYHWLGLRCEVCQSYNTRLVEYARDESAPQPQPQPAQAAAPSAPAPIQNDGATEDANRSAALPEMSEADLPTLRPSRRHSSHADPPPHPLPNLFLDPSNYDVGWSADATASLARSASPQRSPFRGSQALLAAQQRSYFLQERRESEQRRQRDERATEGWRRGMADLFNDQNPRSADSARPVFGFGRGLPFPRSGGGLPPPSSASASTSASASATLPLPAPGTPHTQAEQEQAVGRPFADNSLLDLWGTPLDAAHADAEEEAAQAEEEETETESSEDELMEEDDEDDDDFDPLRLPGHR